MGLWAYVNLSLTIAASSASSLKEPCQTTTLPSTNLCYWITNETGLSIDELQNQCEIQGGSLAVIDSTETQSFIERQLTE